MLPDDKRHGTYAGHMAHEASGVPHCDPCKDARLRYNKRLRLDHERGIRRSLPITGARRRLQALCALGHTQKSIAQRLGVSPQRVHQWTCDEKYGRIYPASHDSIVELYDELSMVVPTGSMSTRTRNDALRRGWAPPLAWDDIDNDGAPNINQRYARDSGLIDEVAVQRFLHGDHQVPLTRAERRAVVIAWEKAGHPLNELERRTGWNVARMKRQVAA